MQKLVVLELDGSLEEGFRASLEVGWEGKRSDNKLVGRLPGRAALTQHFGAWQAAYRNLNKLRSRAIKFKGTTVNRWAAKVERCNRLAEELSQDFNDWLKTEEFREIDTRLRESLDPGEAIRFLVRTEDLRLYKLPWHEWAFFQRYGRAEVSLSSLKYRRLEREYRQKPKVKILAILGHATGIDIEADRKILQELPAEVTFLAQPERQAINDLLWEEGWDIIFFAGHSESDEETGKIYLNDRESLSVSELWYGLRRAVEKGLKLAIFNSCDGVGLARQLDDLCIPLTIVMRDLVPDRVAQQFLKFFLKAFSNGEPFQVAVRQAREQLQGLENDFPCATWLPVIYQNMEEAPPTWEELKAGDRQRKTSQRRRFSFVSGAKIAAGVLVGSVAVYLLLGDRLATAFNDLGRQSRQNDRFYAAKVFYQLATFLSPQSSVSHHNLGKLCEFSLADRSCAIAAYQKAASIDGLAESYAELSRLYILEGKYGQALQLSFYCLNKAESSAVRASCLKNQGWLLLQKAQAKEVETDFRDGLPVDTQAIAGNPKNLSEAEEKFRAAIALAPNSPISHCFLARVLEQQGNVEKAQTHWEFTQKYQGTLDRDYPEGSLPELERCLDLMKERLQE